MTDEGEALASKLEQVTILLNSWEGARDNDLIKIAVLEELAHYLGAIELPYPFTLHAKRLAMAAANLANVIKESLGDGHIDRRGYLQEFEVSQERLFAEYARLEDELRGEGEQQ